MPKKIPLVMLLLIVVLGGVASLAVRAQQPHDTLHERARKAGGRLVWRYRPNRSVLYPNLEELAKRSDAIVVGRTIGHRPKLRQNGRYITEEFLVKVQEVVKGDVPKDQPLLVSLPGGAYRFSDGMLVDVIPRDYQPPQNQQTYTFFLKKKKGNQVKGYMLTSETQGMFAFKQGQVEPADTVKDDPIVVKYHGMGAADFLRELHKAAPRQNKAK
jgi:hypothetical protein